MRTIDKIITDLNCKYGAPMGRSNVGEKPHTITRGKIIVFVNVIKRKFLIVLSQCIQMVPMIKVVPIGVLVNNN